jgi:hypothetical protein
LNTSEFVNDLNSHHHVLQVITHAENGQYAQFQFIKNGLDKGELSIYLTHENPSKTKKKMQKFGIDTDRFIEEALLQIHQVPDILSYDDPIAEFQKFFGGIAPDPQKRFRIAGRPINDIKSKKAMETVLQIERLVHSNFDKINATILCYYDHTKLNQDTMMMDIKHLLECHDGAIFSTIVKPGFAFWNT